MTTIVNANGEMLMQIHGSEEVIALNTPEGGILVADPPHDGMYYDHAMQAWVSLPLAPSTYSVFDYETKKWKETRTLESAKVIHWEELKARRDELEFGGFNYAGHIYDSDPTSQTRIMNAAAMGIPQEWTTKDNTVVSLSDAQIKELGEALVMYVAFVHELGRDARAKIDAAQTIEEVEAITL
jgi:hypothetical protein